MENKISCSAGKTILIDPNTFEGQNSSNNISVPLEDLSIYVQLETTKKARTVLNSNGISNTFSSTDGAYITFIEGDNVATKKALTTSYTDLTTNLTEANVQQALGISSIEIDFNTSNAPLIVINFIDLRGSAIFQNEEYISNNQNKYSEFFNLPYPIFTLTVKGYYGMPVKYNLHLTKFNAKFNSQTGNFEITANFVGYTYAMLSDMLIGYLRAIAYTKKGDEKYRQLKETRTDIKTLDELAQAISNIDIKVDKLKDSDTDVANLSRLDSKLALISTIRGNINTFGQKVSINPEAKDFRYVLKDSKTSSQSPSQFLSTTNSFTFTTPSFSPQLSNKDIDVELAIKEYNENISANVKLFNTEIFENISLNEKELSFSNVKSYNGLSMKLLNSTGNTLNSELSQASDKNKTRNELKVYGRQNNIAFDKIFDVYDLTEQIEILNLTETNLKKEGNKLKYKVADKLRNNIEKELDFKPTIRQIVGSFTAAVEVLMHVLYDVSTEATTSQPRKNELEKKFDSFDYKELSINNISNNSASGELNKNFYPWPEYRENDGDGSYVEKYLGDPNVLDATNVTELIFIDDLFNAFIKSAEKIRDIEITSDLNKTSWTPINPIDTRIFIEEFPYKRIQGNSWEEVIALLIERAFIYIGYTNLKLSEKEIIDIANKECELILTLINNDTIKKSLSQLTFDKFTDIKAINNGVNTSLIKKSNNEWYYNFIYDLSEDGKKILPITTSENNKFEYDFEYLENTKIKQINGELFLTNYKTSNYLNPDNTINLKEDDGGIYIKIISPETYKSSIKPTTTINESSTLLLDVLRLPQEKFNEQFNEVGFNQYSGPYSIQDYKVLDYGVDKMDRAEYRIMFYTDTNVSNSDFELLNIGSLSYKRQDNLTTPYDIKSEKIKQFENIQKAIDYTVGDNSTHNSLGDNRILLSNLIEEKNNNISYPFVGFQVVVNSTDTVPIGLFGSRLYNEQTSEYAKALLFLHTLPWNGLYTSKNGAPNGIFNVNEILNSFGNRGGFISAPRLWVAFIGGMLWRADSTKPTVLKGTEIINGGGSGALDPIKWRNGTESLIPTYENTDLIPTKLQYLTAKDNILYDTGSMVFPLDTFTGLDHSFIDLDDVLLQLPEQVKNEFKQVFFDFVQIFEGDSDWSILKNKLEVFKPSTGTWVNTFNALFTNYNIGGGLYPDGTISRTKMLGFFDSEHDGKKTLNDYAIFSSYEGENDLKYNFMTELKDDSDGVKMILDLMVEEVYIANTTYRIWQKNQSSGSNYGKTSGVFVNNSDLETFINTCISNFNKLNSQTIDEKKKQEINEVFGSNNENIIKFQLYRTCKNIYDKWIGGSDSLTNLMFGKDELRNNLDKELSENFGDGELRLIDSFRFVNRSFKDIGDEFIVNPTPILSYLKQNKNSSFYDIIGSLLSSNNFDFIALPSFINFKDETLSTLFKPMSTFDAFNAGEIGPSFVCVYVGQTSKNLDFKSSEYPNDGIDFRCNSEGNLIPTLAKDFYQQNEVYENKVAVFSVNYSQQNQNIFKDIILDQSEFTETAEYLQIIDDIATKGSENRRTYGGQNIFNVYSVRSYKAEVEMMGNAMVQPMMYFQLNNIPMFHGAYMITRVKHNIKPNHMSTSFTGVRIRNVETKLIKDSEFYMSLLESIGIDPIDESIKEKSTDLVVYSGNTAATRPPKKSIKCDTVTRDVKTFEDVLELVVDNLEGSYCPGGATCGSNNSGETLWGLDRINHNGPFDSKLWGLVDKEDKTKWNATKYPKPKDEPEIYDVYFKIIKRDYDTFSKKLSDELKTIIESDGRLYFNMIYAVFNGSGYFQEFGKLLQNAYDNGKRTSDELLDVFIEARLSGGKIFWPNTPPKSAEIIANTGVDIQKMVGLGSYCTKPIV